MSDVGRDADDRVERRVVQKVQECCPELFAPEHGDSAANSNSCQVVPLGGGLSNELFVVSLNRDTSDDAASTKRVLVRLFPADDGSLGLDRALETKRLAYLASHDLGPHVLGTFDGGRVEEFYYQHRPLAHDELPAYAHQVGALLARLHQLDDVKDIDDKSVPAGGEIWDCMKQWWHYAHDAAITHGAANGQEVLRLLETIHGQKTWLHHELVELPSRSKEHKFCRENVLCHMDCQSLNLLVPSQQDDATPISEVLLKWIDFEYMGVNPRGIDIANHLCEHMDMNNQRANFETDFPPEDVQERLLKHYLDSLCSEDDASYDLQCLRRCVCQYALLSHLMWATWSLVQHTNTNLAIDFDYLQYAKQRMDGYRIGKQQFFDGDFRTQQFA